LILFILFSPLIYGEYYRIVGVSRI